MIQQKAVRRLNWALALATVVGGVALAGAAPASAQAGAACQLSHLPVPDGTVNSFVDGGDPTGRYVVGAALVIDASGQGSRVNLLWTDGEFAEVRLPYAEGFAFLTGVNSAGVAVGYGIDSEGRSHGFTYDDGVVRELPSPEPGSQTRAVAINSRGDVLGEVVDPASSLQRPVVWLADQPGTVRQLPTDDTVAAVDIDDDGTVVAQTDGGAAIAGPAVVWRPDGTVTELPPATAGATSIVIAIRNGWAAGWENATGGSTSLRWNLGTGSVTMLPDVWFTYDVGRHGEVAGQDNDLRPVIVRRSGAVVHPSVPEGLRGGVEVLAQRGVAYGFVEGQAVVWRGC